MYEMHLEEKRMVWVRIEYTHNVVAQDQVATKVPREAKEYLQKLDSYLNTVRKLFVDHFDASEYR